MSSSSPVAAATADARVTVTEPPAAGTVALPLDDVVPLLTAAWIVALPHAAGSELTVTLATLAPERFGTTRMPAFVQRGVATEFSPMDWVADGNDEARPAPAKTSAGSTRAKITLAPGLSLPMAVALDDDA
jgi:hypothetical protein